MAAPRPSETHRACDHCRRRKTKCDSTKPCSNCKTSQLQCLYTSVPKKRGPKTPHTRAPINGHVQRASERVSVHETTIIRELSLNSVFVVPLEQPLPEHTDLPNTPVQLARPPESVSVSAVTPSPWTPSSTSPATVSSWLPDFCQRPHSLHDRLCGVYLTLLAAIDASLPFVSGADIANQCIDLFMQYTFPSSPVIHEPTLRAHAAYFFPQAQATEAVKSVFKENTRNDGSSYPMVSRARDFALITSLCASVASVMPDSLLPWRHGVMQPFLHSSRETSHAIEDYDIQNVNASSIIIRIMHSTALQNITGRPEVAWHILGQASLMCLRLGLHSETSIQKIQDPVERQLLRSCFWVLYAADNASFAVGNRESVLRNDCFPGGLTLRSHTEHSAYLMGPARSPSVTQFEASLRHGIQAMPRLWSAAAGLISRISTPLPLPCPESGTPGREIDGGRQQIEDDLTQAYLDFSVIPDHLPVWLQTPSLIAAQIKHGNNSSTSNGSSDGWDDFQNKAFWVQRCTLMMSFYCARLLILQKCIEHDRCAIVGMTNAPLPVQMKKIDMVLDFLRELEEIPFVYHQIKGEPSVERVRCVGSILLEMMETASNETIVARARSCFARLMEILAKLDSKASDALASGKLPNGDISQMACI